LAQDLDSYSEFVESVLRRRVGEGVEPGEPGAARGKSDEPGGDWDARLSPVQKRSTAASDG